MDTDAAKLWCPTAWLDEVMPHLEETPDAFIFSPGAGYRLRPPPSSPDHDVDCYDDPLEIGQVVPFRWCESFGRHIVTVNGDGSWSCPTGWPDRATHFWDGDSICGSMDDLVRGADWQPPLESGRHEVSVYRWSDDVLFRLEIGAGGSARFAACAGTS